MATDVTQASVDRRNLLRGGAVLAGAAGIAALGAVAAPSASASNGEPVIQGQAQQANATTMLRLDPDDVGVQAAAGGSPDPTLSLENDDGPTLKLQALSEEPSLPLDMGEISNSTLGPYIGIEDWKGDVTTGYLATNFDVARIFVAEAIRPFRAADTRTTVGRGGIIRSSANAFDAEHRLIRGSWMDVVIAPSNSDFTLQSAFVNLTVAGPLTHGYLTLYSPGDRPATSNLNFVKDEVDCNSGFVLLGTYNDYFVIRVYTSGTTHVVVDLMGVTGNEVPGPTSAPAALGPAQVRRARAARRPTVRYGRRSR